jgi:hypothetical protein
MFRPSTKFTYYDSDDPDGTNLPDLSPEAKISEHDHDQISFFARQVLNGTLDYLIINVFGSGANLPVNNDSVDVVSTPDFHFFFAGLFHFYKQNDLHSDGSCNVSELYIIFIVAPQNRNCSCIS